MCGLQFDVVHRAMRYCTPLCRAAASKRRVGRTSKPYVRNLNCRHCGAGLTGKAGQVYCSDRCQENEYNCPESRSLRVGRRCEHCGTAIPDSARVNKRHCSDRCTILANQAIRRARRKELPAERISRLDVLDRDGWVCHLCHLPIGPQLVGRHPMSASLDHVVPLSWPDSPGHVWSNVAAAHLRCNISKGAGARVGR